MGEEQDPVSLLRYLDVLLGTYPDGINQTELAEKVGVSEAAVSQRKGELIGFTVKDKFLFREIVLSTEPSVSSRIAWLFLTNKMTTRFVTSRYGRALLASFDLHNKISSESPLYAKYFRPEDTNLMVATAIVQLGALDRIGKIGVPLSEIDARADEVSMKFIKAAIEMLSHLKLRISSREQLLWWLGIRDRWFYFLEDTIYQLLPNLEILSKMTPDERLSYLAVYRNTATYYLSLAFAPVTDFLKERAKEKRVEIESRYNLLGSVFRPPDRQPTLSA